MGRETEYPLVEVESILHEEGFHSRRDLAEEIYYLRSQVSELKGRGGLHGDNPLNRLVVHSEDVEPLISENHVLREQVYVLRDGLRFVRDYIENLPDRTIREMDATVYRVVRKLHDHARRALNNADPATERERDDAP